MQRQVLVGLDLLAILAQPIAEWLQLIGVGRGGGARRARLGRRWVGGPWRNPQQAGDGPGQPCVNRREQNRLVTGPNDRLGTRARIGEERQWCPCRLQPVECQGCHLPQQCVAGGDARGRCCRGRCCWGRRWCRDGIRSGAGRCAGLPLLQRGADLRDHSVHGCDRRLSVRQRHEAAQREQHQQADRDLEDADLPASARHRRRGGLRQRVLREQAIGKQKLGEDVLVAGGGPGARQRCAAGQVEAAEHRRGMVDAGAQHVVQQGRQRLRQGRQARRQLPERGSAVRRRQQPCLHRGHLLRQRIDTAVDPAGPEPGAQSGRRCPAEWPLAQLRRQGGGGRGEAAQHLAPVEDQLDRQVPAAGLLRDRDRLMQRAAQRDQRVVVELRCAAEVIGTQHDDQRVERAWPPPRRKLRRSRRSSVPAIHRCQEDRPGM